MKSSIVLLLISIVVLPALADGLTGDFNGDGVSDCSDVDALANNIASGANDPAFDLNADGLVNLIDLEMLPLVQRASQQPLEPPVLLVFTLVYQRIIPYLAPGDFVDENYRAHLFHADRPVIALYPLLLNVQMRDGAIALCQRSQNFFISL